MGFEDEEELVLEDEDVEGLGEEVVGEGASQVHDYQRHKHHALDE